MLPTLAEWEDHFDEIGPSFGAGPVYESAFWAAQEYECRREDGTLTSLAFRLLAERVEKWNKLAARMG